VFEGRQHGQGSTKYQSGKKPPLAVRKGVGLPSRQLLLPGKTRNERKVRCPPGSEDRWALKGRGSGGGGGSRGKKKRINAKHDMQRNWTLDRLSEQRKVGSSR